MTNTSQPQAENTVIENPVDRLRRVRQKLALVMSVDWDSPIVGAECGKDYILGEVLNEIDEISEQIGGTS